MTRPITAGVDGTQESLAALDWAAREAVRRGLPLRVVHAWRYAEALTTADRETQRRWVSEGVAEAVRTVSERHPGLPVATDVLEGSPAKALADAAAGAEMLVLGSRGHGPVVGFLLGSVGQQVIAEAARPVVAVRAEDDAAAEAAGR
ncbi:universal stress protein, partial [Streptomyces sp. SID486]